MMKRSFLLACTVGLLAAACSDEETTPLSEIVSVREATNDECATGGQTILVGIDTNGDGALTDGEIRNSASVCNGEVGEPGEQGGPGEQGIPGTNALINSTAEAPGANCADGGFRIDVGLDDNQDGTLSTDEIDVTTYVCNGADGMDGANGLTSLTRTSTTGAVGCGSNGGLLIESGLDDNGDGTLSNDEVETSNSICNGDDGATSLVEVADEAAGANCTAGGQRITSGVDENGDGTLTGIEIADVSFICNAVNNLVSVSPELAGTSTVCDTGGTRINIGLDTNVNGILDTAEVTQVSFSCNGVGSLVSLTPEPVGTNCADGGQRVDAGADTNGNGTLDTAEITSTTFVCDGADGMNGADGANGSLVNVTDEPSGANCLNGGVRIDSGPDLDFDGVLEPGEITATVYACDGEARQTLVTSAPVAPGADCANGGFRLESGLDANSNGTLEPAEIASTSFACNGANGSLARVSAEPAGANCLNGGVRIDSGPDLNFNGVLDAGEITATAYACDGSARESLVTSTPVAPGPDCTNGGVRIDSGLDTNGNGTLDTAEITGTSFVCNGLAAVPFAIQTASLDDGRAGQPYSATLTAAGGTGGSYAWSISAGALPAGLTLEPTGTPDTVINGAPTAFGTFTFTVQVVDFFGQAASRAYTIDIAPPALEITSFTVPRVDPPNAYSFTLTSTGGNPPYTWSVAEGALPNGLSLTPAGVISGTPMANVQASALVRVTDASNETRDARLMFRNRKDWVGFVGDLDTDNQGEAFAVNIAGGTAANAIIINPAVANSTGDLGQTSSPAFKDAVWSPDGTKVAMIGDLETEGSEELWWIDLNAAVPTPIKGHADFTSSDQDVDTDDIFWSPDSRYFGFIADDQTNSEFNLFLVDTTTTAVGVQVNGTLPTGSDVDTSDGFRFSPDSTKLAYISDEITSTQETLFVVDLTAASLAPEQVSAGGSTADVSNFIWTPDSDSLIFVSDEQRDGVLELWISDVSGTPTTPIRVNAPIANTSGDVGTAVSFDRPSDFGVSPDGQRLYYIADAQTESVDELYVVDLDTPGTARRVSPGGLTNTSQDVDRAFFTPDSQNLVFVADTMTVDVQEVFLADATGGGAPPVTLNASLPTSADVVTAEVVADPKNRGVFFEADARTNNRQEVFFVAFSAPGTMVNLLPAISSTSDANTFIVAPNGDSVVINADPNTASEDELFLVNISALPFGEAQTVNDTLTTGGDVDTGATSTSRDYDIVGEGEYILYIADQDTDGVDTPYIVPVSNGVPGASTALISPVSGGDATNVHR